MISFRRTTLLMFYVPAAGSLTATGEEHRWNTITLLADDQAEWWEEDR